MSPIAKSNPTDIVFSPAQIARVGTEYLMERAANQGAGIPFGLASIDAFFNPALPGDLITIVARPGCGKTGLMIRWARWRAQQLREQQIYGRAVVYITFEQHVEDLHAFHVAAEAEIDVGKMARGTLTADEIELIRHHGARRVGLPLWFIGHSQERRARRPRMDINNLIEALYAIETWQEENQRNFIIDMLFIDYLQRMPLPPGSESKVVGLDLLLNSLKDIALQFACPTIVGVQARREVDSYTVPIPTMADGQWCSSIEQVSDKVFGLVRPRRYKKEGESFGKIIVSGHTQMYIGLLKQKLGKDNMGEWVTFAPEYNRLDETEMRNCDLNNLDG
jgi:replicative DNA helicase